MEEYLECETAEETLDHYLRFHHIPHSRHSTHCLLLVLKIERKVNYHALDISLGNSL